MNELSRLLSTKKSHFRFDTDVTPLSSFVAPVIACTIYLALVFLIKQLMANRKPFDLSKVVTIYNFTMSFLSGLLFLSLSHELLTLYARQGFLGIFCDARGQNTSGHLIVFYYINYLFKYVELVDTMFLCLRKKSTPFIHVYHHAITLALCWTQLTVQTCMQWSIIEMNLFVHIFLYAYYGLYEMRINVWWKRYLTTVQIIQFLIGVSASLGAMSLRWAYILLPTTPFTKQLACHGSWWGSGFGIAILISYLYLFIKLYQEKYNDTPSVVVKKKVPGSANLIKSAPGSSAAKEFSSTFSPHAKTGLFSSASSASSSSASASASSIFSTPSSSILPSADDAFASLRNQWLAHPLLVADRMRWEEHVRASRKKECKHGKGEEVSAHEKSDDLKLERGTIETEGLKKRFGSNSSRL